MTYTPEGRPDRDPICPICGEVCDTVYLRGTAYVIGCENCVTVSDAWDTDACFENETLALFQQWLDARIEEENL